MKQEAFELDHIFLIISNEQTAHDMMEQAGLRVNYSRSHPGQGTRNLCACLDNVFLELLWFDGSEISPETEKITLAARTKGEGSPFGISWRGKSEFENRPDGTVPYFAPFLPSKVSIPVASASLNLSFPFVFKSPGGTAPINRKDDLVGERQAPELTIMSECEIMVQNDAQVRKLLEPFEEIKVRHGENAIRFTVMKPDGSIGKEIEWKAVNVETGLG